MKIKRSIFSKKMSSAVILLLNASLVAQATGTQAVDAQVLETQTPADIVQMSGRINDIQSTVDNLVQTMNTSAEPGTSINISDYLEAKAALMATIQTETDLFKRCVVEIRDSVQGTVQVLDQELADLRETYRVTHADGIHDLIQVKERGRSGAIQGLERTVQNRYEACIRRLVTLNNKIQIVVGVTDRNRLLLKRIGLALVAPTGLGLAATVIGAIRIRDNNDDHFYGDLFMGNPDVEASITLRRFRGTSRRSMDRASAEQSTALFEGCESQACVYLLGDLYQVWLRQVREVNRDLDLIENVELKAVSMTRARRIERHMTHIIEIVASQKAAVILPRVLPVGDAESRGSEPTATHCDNPGSCQ